MASGDKKVITLLKSISMLGSAPDGQLAASLAKECREFAPSYGTTESECIDFLRNIRDMAVYTGGASYITIKLISTMVDSYPETDQEFKQRRIKLKEKYNISD